MALWKSISFKTPEKGSEHKKPYRTTVSGVGEIRILRNAESGEDEKILHLSNVSSAEDGSGSAHKRQCVDLNRESAKELFDILKREFKFSEKDKGEGK